MKHYIFLPILLLLIASCQTIELPDEEAKNSSKKQKVNILLRSHTNEALPSPLAVYALDANGTLRATQTLNDASGKLSLSLPAGQYSIVALAGHGIYGLNDFPVNGKSQLRPAQNNVATQPLMRGEAALEVGDRKAHVSLTLHYAVASINLRLTGIPSKVSQVKIRLDQQYEQLSLLGQYSGSASSTLMAQRSSDGSWEVPATYLFPASTSSSVLTLSLVEAEQTRNFSFTLSQKLKAATPYRFSGTYTQNNEINVSGEILSAGWQNTVNQDFSFSSDSPIVIVPNEGQGGKTPGSSDKQPSDTSPNLTLTGLPAPGSIWQGKHIVGILDNISDTGADILLISRQKWDGLFSAKNEGGYYVGQDLADNYEEAGLRGWRIPTKEEARALSQTLHGEILTTLNENTQKLGGEEIYDQIDLRYQKYLCEGGQYTYSFKPNSSISTAGKTSSNYYLLLVKRIHVDRQP